MPSELRRQPLARRVLPRGAGPITRSLSAHAPCLLCTRVAGCSAPHRASVQPGRAQRAITSSVSFRAPQGARLTPAAPTQLGTRRICKTRRVRGRNRQAPDPSTETHPILVQPHPTFVKPAQIGPKPHHTSSDTYQHPYNLGQPGMVPPGHVGTSRLGTIAQSER